MTTCKKVYSEIPIAHRQHLHDGHCSFVHGHNWSIAVEFSCESTDENGFVVDFGKLGFLKDWISENLDHACLFAEEDGTARALMEAAPEAWKPYFIDRPSCEGLAKRIYEVFGRLVSEKTGGRVGVVSVEVREDSKNSARYSE